MCTSEKNLKLCSCAKLKAKPNHQHLSKKAKKKQILENYTTTEPIWSLHQYVETVDSGMMGRIMMPSNSLDKELTKEFVLEQLNKGNCFDFEYVPKEKDWLKIEQRYVEKEIKNHYRPMTSYLSFIFSDKRWESGLISVFDDIYEKYDNGKVKIE